MLNLTVYNAAETQSFTLDLYENAPVNLNYQFSDVSEVQRAKASYSQKFRIPATAKNRQFFGSFDKPNVDDDNGYILGNFSVKKKIRAELSYNTVQLMRGHVQVKGAVVQKQAYSDIELIFYAETIDLSRALKESKLGELNTSTLNHTLNNTNIQASWLGGLKTGNVRYGIIDKGNNWNFSSADTTPWTSTQGLFQAELTPFVRIEWLLSKIISSAGFTYTSAFFQDNDRQDMYLPAFNGSKFIVSDDNDSSQQLCVAGLVPDQGLSTSYVTLDLIDTVGNGYDYGSNFSNTSHGYTASYSGIYTIATNMMSTPPSLGTSQARLMRNGSFFQNLTTSSTGEPTTILSVFLEAGDVITVQARRASGVAQSMLGDQGAGSWHSGSTWFMVANVSEPLAGITVDIADNLPDMRQIDFLLSLQKLFNLVIVPDKNKPKHLIIEPFNDYIASGAQKDWTNKIDHTKDTHIKPTTELQKAVQDWTYSQGQDFLNKAIQDGVGRVYGRHRVEDSDNDYAVGEAKIETGFAPYVVSYIPASAFKLHRMVTSEGSIVENPKPRIAYWNGALTSATWYLTNDAGSASPQSLWPTFSNYDVDLPSVQNNDLNYGYERAFIPVVAHPVNSSYYRFWMNYVNELYSADARIVTMHIHLTSADIQDFEFNDKIYIQDTYYRVLRITNYDATQGGSVKVELIRILSDIADCANQPTGLNSSGHITFNNNATNFGDEVCCKRYGYLWFPDKQGGNSRCLPQPIDTAPNVS